MPYKDPEKKKTVAAASRRRIVQEHRRYLALRQFLICPWCGKAMSGIFDGERTHIDHVVPLEDGGYSHTGGVIPSRSHPPPAAKQWLPSNTFQP